jgi:hypothetical protein
VEKDTKDTPQLALPHQKFMNFLNPKEGKKKKRTNRTRKLDEFSTSLSAESSTKKEKFSSL